MRAIQLARGSFSFVLAACLTAQIASVQLQGQVTFFDTIGTPTGTESYYGVTSGSWIAQSFLMSSTYDLGTLTLLMNYPANNSVGLTLGIYANDDSGTSETTDDTPDTGSAAIYDFGTTILNNSGPQDEIDFTPSSTVTLSSGNTYWVVATTTSPGDYSWYYRTAATPDIGDTIGWSDNTGSGWSGADDSTPQMMRLTSVPEPGEYALLFGLGLLGFAGYRRWAAKTA